jgi:hypothetical protein
MATIKLTPVQKEVLRLINEEGYELGTYSGYHSSVSLQKGGLGKGGKTHKITWETFSGLQTKNLIEACPKDPERHYSLTAYKISEEGLKLLS